MADLHLVVDARGVHAFSSVSLERAAVGGYYAGLLEEGEVYVVISPAEHGTLRVLSPRLGACFILSPEHRERARAL